jgi:transcription antitermination factor NusG
MPITIESQPGASWVPAYCRPRTEKVVADYCQRHGIPCYLPLLLRRKRYQRRTVETLLPMFPSYVFVQIGPETRSVFLECHKIVQVVDVDGGQERALITELNELRRLESAKYEVELEVMPELQPGTPVAVTDGPLRGTTGIIETRKGKTRVIVNIELLGSSVVAEMDLGELEATDDD